ncbi:MAG: restriction endonuclease subunit S [Gemmatimonadetes bacterium]|nr:restriction endonuclease subunit S [Gemmatimonadota bacterium]
MNSSDSPWDIPNSWAWIRIGDITDVVGGGTPRTDNGEYWTGGNVPWITPADLSGYSKMRIARGARFISQPGLDNSGAKLLPVGTVLMYIARPRRVCGHSLEHAQH